MRRTLCIFNPVAGRGRSARVWQRLGGSFESDPNVDVVATERPGHATELARGAVRRGYGAVVAVGGDGTVHEVVNGLAGQTDVALAIVPAGSGNDFSRSLGIPQRPSVAARLLRERAGLRTVDLGRVGDEYFTSVAGVGFDAEVAAAANLNGAVGQGTFRYLHALAKTLSAYRNAPVVLRVDDREPLKTDILLLAAGNAKFYAGGMKIVPSAEVDDGMLDLVIAAGLTKFETLRALPRVYRGTHVSLPKISTVRARKVAVESPVALSVHADGEIVGRVPVTIECVPRALRVLVPERR